MRNVGEYSLVHDKIRVKYETGTESVLFEDVSSLSWESDNRSNGLYLIFMIPGLFCVGLAETSALLATWGMIAFFILAFVLTIINKIYWDNVIIETRGGKIISFSVDAGEGAAVMEKIEEDKRNHINS